MPPSYPLSPQRVPYLGTWVPIQDGVLVLQGLVPGRAAVGAENAGILRQVPQMLAASVSHLERGVWCQPSVAPDGYCGIGLWAVGHMCPSRQCCQTLVSHRVDPSLRDEDGYTAADLAEYHGHQDCAQYLRETARPVSLRVPSHPSWGEGEGTPHPTDQ